MRGEPWEKKTSKVLSTMQYVLFLFLKRTFTEVITEKKRLFTLTLSSKKTMVRLSLECQIVLIQSTTPQPSKMKYVRMITKAGKIVQKQNIITALSQRENGEKSAIKKAKLEIY